MKILGAALLAGSILCHAPIALAQAVAEDAFISQINGLSNSDHFYRWKAFERGAEEAANQGFLGEADFLFAEAIKEAQAVRLEAARQHDRWCMMLAKTETERARFYQDRLKRIPKAEKLYKRALSFYRPELAKQRTSSTLCPNKELVQDLSKNLTAYSQLMEATNRREEAQKLLQEVEVAKLTLLAPPPHSPERPGQPLDIDFGPYMARLQRQISAKWTPVGEKVSSRVVTVFKIHKNGELSDVRIEKGATELADFAALKAIGAAAPLDHLPQGAQDDIDIQFTFDCNALSNSSAKLMKPWQIDDYMIPSHEEVKKTVVRKLIPKPLKARAKSLTD